MKHIYQFQPCLFFLCLVMLLSLSPFVKASDNARNITSLSGKFLVSSGNHEDTSSKALTEIGDGSNRMGQDCSKDDIVVFQGSTVPLPNGVPAFTVEIINACASGCNIEQIHITCGWFSSVRLVNPRVFRRLYYDDCLVNDGEPLGPGETISFQYANSFSYPLSVSSVSCF